jgi:hypothetical protein
MRSVRGMMRVAFRQKEQRNAERFQCRTLHPIQHLQHLNRQVTLTLDQRMQNY